MKVINTKGPRTVKYKGKWIYFEKGEVKGDFDKDFIKKNKGFKVVK